MGYTDVTTIEQLLGLTNLRIVILNKNIVKDWVKLNSLPSIEIIYDQNDI